MCTPEWSRLVSVSSMCLVWTGELWADTGSYLQHRGESASTWLIHPQDRYHLKSSQLEAFPGYSYSHLAPPPRSAGTAPFGQRGKLPSGTRIEDTCRPKKHISPSTSLGDPKGKCVYLYEFCPSSHAWEKTVHTQILRGQHVFLSFFTGILKSLFLWYYCSFIFIVVGDFTRRD